MKKALSISAPCSEVSYFPHNFFNNPLPLRVS
jgi:hypothetical protein